MTLLVPATATLSVNKKTSDKKVGKEAEAKQMLIEMFRHSAGKSSDIFVNHFLRLSITNLREIIHQLFCLSDISYIDMFAFRFVFLFLLEISLSDEFSIKDNFYVTSIFDDTYR